MRTNPDKFLKDVSGVAHVGANVAQERELYSTHGLSVYLRFRWPEDISQPLKPPSRIGKNECLCSLRPSYDVPEG